MLNNKKNICFWGALLIMLSITACKPEEPKELEKSTPDMGQSTVPADKTLLADTPAHISELFSNDFIVDADVHVPDIQKADVLFAKYRQFDEQALSSILRSEKTPDEDGNGSSTIVMSDSYFIYNTECFNYLKFPTDGFDSNNDIQSDNKRFDEVYVQENLGFMTRAEALRTVSDVFRKLSIDIADNAEIYAIDSETMQTQQDERIQKVIDEQRTMEISPTYDPTDEYQIKKTFSREDDFYILYFTMTQDKIPITQKSHIIMAGERDLNGSTARASFSKKGLIALSCSGIYQAQGIAESPDTLISVEKAVEKAFEIHNAITSTGKVTVAAIDFEYVPVPYNENHDEVMLTPAWSLTLNGEDEELSKSEEEASESITKTRMVFINAVTGEEINYES